MNKFSHTETDQTPKQPNHRIVTVCVLAAGMRVATRLASTLPSLQKGWQKEAGIVARSFRVLLPRV